MKNRKLFSIMLVACACALGLASCEKQINVDVEAQQRRVVVKALGEEGAPLTVKLTYSRPVFSTYYVADGDRLFEEITGATLKLTVNGSTPVAATDDGQGYYSFAYIPQAGDRLLLTVEVAGEEPISAEAEVPQPPQVDGVAMEEGPVVRFTLTDRAPTLDNYAVRVRRTDTTFWSLIDTNGNITDRDTSWSSRYVTFKCTDYQLYVNVGDIYDIDDPESANTYWGDEFFFSDANISGQSHTVSLELQEGWYSSYGDDSDYRPHFDDSLHHWTDTMQTTYRLEVSALARDHYLYLQTLDAYDDDPLTGLFSEPVQIHSNISGGIGIFGIRTRQVHTVPEP